ncbi:MAG: DNA polymerase III subunit gamma/tau, partial [Candidatus Sericytochromatia bacterium]|nr:DNA polymerase III subunit gamma/tau [Candidatus Sericytochromatia bacterium]
MGHQALYRKWRPQTFEDLVGQDNISRTLINAINTNRVSHAYLFCGSRGTGKTSTARILAKSLNCEARVLGSPCNICPSCIEQLQGSALDVIEIDAASNRGISEIKSLIEQVRFASVSGKYKVYIIDEFHMLTTEAFNAILKTLEEPPEKVVFILATTEAHKILPTIISRCQKFDFQRIPVSSLISRLRYISDQENIKISDDSLLSIARKANGGLRDALSLLDQINSFSSGDGEVANELVYQVLGMVSTDFLANLAIAISESDPVKIISTLTELIRAGNDPIVIMTETINFFRHLLIVKVSPEMAEHLEVPVTSIEVLKKISESFSKDDILENLGFLNEAIERVKKTQMAQLWLEINFVQLCKRAKINTFSIPQQITQNTSMNNNENISNPSLINDLMNKINLLESKLSNLQESTIKNFNNIQTQVPQNHEENRNNDQIEKISNISELRHTKNTDVNHKNSNTN